MQIDYEKLASIAADPTSRSTMAKDTSEVLASYMQILSNLIFAAERLSESEMAMIASSLNRWVTKKNVSVNRSYGIGKIVQMEWGNNKSDIRRKGNFLKSIFAVRAVKASTCVGAFYI